MNQRVVLIGAVHESLDALDALVAHPRVRVEAVVTLPPDAGAKLSGFIDLGAKARDLGISVIEVADANDPSCVEHIRGIRPSLLIVVGWTRLIGQDLLSVPEHGTVGFHASLLPDNRGRAPVNWAIIRGETVTGNTMMLLDAGVDTGKIVDQRETPIYIDDTCNTVYERVARLGHDMLSDNLDALIAGTATATPQDQHETPLLPKRIPAMGIVDWKRSPVEVHNWVRAQTMPYPGAYTMWKGEKLMLWETAVPMRSEHQGLPGTVLHVDDGGVRVASGTGSVVVTHVGLEGDRPQPAAIFAADHDLGDGTRFALPDESTVMWSLGLASSAGESR